MLTPLLTNAEGSIITLPGLHLHVGELKRHLHSGDLMHVPIFHVLDLIYMYIDTDSSYGYNAGVLHKWSFALQKCANKNE